MTKQEVAVQQTSDTIDVDLDQLQIRYDVYNRSEQATMEPLIALARISRDVQRASVASAIQIIEQSRGLDHDISVRHILQQYPIDTGEGQTLFHLINLLCKLTDKKAQQNCIRDCFACADWMQDSQRRRIFFQNMASWGLSVASRLYSADNEGGALSVAARIGRRFSSPIMHTAIMQAVNRLTDPLIYARDTLVALQKKKRHEQLLHHRLGLPFGLYEALVVQNQQAYLQAIEQIGQHRDGFKNKSRPSIHVDLSHFTGPLFPYQTLQLSALVNLLLPLYRSSCKQDVSLILASTAPYSAPLLIELVIGLQTQQHRVESEQQQGLLGLELSAAEPSCLPLLQSLNEFQTKIGQTIIVRLTQERTKPVLQPEPLNTLALLGIGHYLLQHHLFIPWFVSHNSYIVACLRQLAHQYNHQRFEIHHRFGLLDAGLAQLKQALAPVAIRIEAPTGTKHHHHHLILQRLREIADPTGYVAKLMNAQLTIADLVRHPAQQLPKQFARTNWWSSQIVQQYCTRSSHQVCELDERQHASTATDLSMKLKFSASQNDWRTRSILARWRCLNQTHFRLKSHSFTIIEALKGLTPNAAVALGQFEAALKQQAQVLASAKTWLEQPPPLPLGSVLWINSEHYCLSPLLADLTWILLFGNDLIIQIPPQQAELGQILIQHFCECGLPNASLRISVLPRDQLQLVLSQDLTIIRVIIADPVRDAQFTNQSLVRQNRWPIPQWRTTLFGHKHQLPLVVMIDETAAELAVYHCLHSLWSLAPALVLVSSAVREQVVEALQALKFSQTAFDSDSRSLVNVAAHSLQSSSWQARLDQFIGIDNAHGMRLYHDREDYGSLYVFQYEDGDSARLLQELIGEHQVARTILLSQLPMLQQQVSYQWLLSQEIHIGWPKHAGHHRQRGLQPSQYCRAVTQTQHKPVNHWLGHLE